MTYNDLVTTVANMAIYDPADADFLQMLPNAIAYAEGRMYRELDMIGTRFTDIATLATGDRRLTLPSQTLIVETLSVITPSFATPEEGTRHPLVPVTRVFLDFAYPSDLFFSMPEYFAMVGQTSAVVGPWPDDNYTVEVYGIQTPTPLSSSNQNTLLTTYLPDAFLAAVMIFVTGFQRDFGAQADDPKIAVSWETQYEALMTSAVTNEYRKKFSSQAWTSQIPNPVATPPRQ